MRGCDGSGYVGEFEPHGDAAKCSGCPACWSKDDWRILHHAASMAVQLYDSVEQENGVPRSAPLYGKRDRLLEVARGLDHTARHGLTPQNTFDLSAFRKEIEGRLRLAEDAVTDLGSRGYSEHEAVAEGERQAFEGVLALLPGEGETDG